MGAMTLVDMLAVVQKRFWLIVAVAVIAGAVAALLCYFTPPSYEAESLLLITKLRLDVTLDPRFQTVAEENLVNLTIQDEQVRRQTLLGLVKNSDLMREVLDELTVALGPEQMTLPTLQHATEATTEGNLIVLRARAGTPEKAATMANTWSSVYTRRVNQLYSATSPTPAEIQREVDAALAAYEATTAALNEFELTSSEDELNRLIDQKKRILAGLQEEQIVAAQERVSRLLTRLSQIDQILLDIQGFKAQLASSPSDATLTAGQKLALFALEATALGAHTDLGYTLELSENAIGSQDVTTREAIDLLERLVSTLEGVRLEGQAALDGQTAALLGGQDLLAYGADNVAALANASSLADSPSTAVATLVARLQDEINALQAALQTENVIRQDLQNASTVARENYLTLVRKAAEIQIVSQLPGVEVQVAAEAQPPLAPAFPRPLLTIGLAVVGGGLGGLALAFLLAFWPRLAARG